MAKYTKYEYRQRQLNKKYSGSYSKKKNTLSRASKRFLKSLHILDVGTHVSAELGSNY